MVDRIRNLLARFPENERAVRDMIRNRPDFDALCEEYAEIGRELERLAQLKDAAAAVQSDSLRKRRMAVEEKLLTLLEGHQPSSIAERRLAVHVSALLGATEPTASLIQR